MSTEYCQFAVLFCFAFRIFFVFLFAWRPLIQFNYPYDIVAVDERFLSVLFWQTKNNIVCLVAVDALNVFAKSKM